MKSRTGKKGFRQNTDSRSTDPLLTPLLTPLPRFKFINKFSLPETSKMAVALQISRKAPDLRFPTPYSFEKIKQ